MEIMYGIQNNATLDYPVGNNIKAAMNYAKNTSYIFKSIEGFKNVSVNIYCRGSSGAILAALFATHIPNEATIVHIKKPNEVAHCPSSYFNFGNFINVVIDDFISTGETLNAIYKEVFIQKIHCLITQREHNIGTLNFTPDIFITLR